jgi:hypothetical protein
LLCPDSEESPDSPRILRHIELIDDEAAEYGIKIVKTSDRLMAKKYGYRKPPGITYFRKGKYINYDGLHLNVFNIFSGIRITLKLLLLLLVVIFHHYS